MYRLSPAATHSDTAFVCSGVRVMGLTGYPKPFPPTTQAGPAGSARKLVLQEFHAAAHGGVLLHHVVHGLAGVDHGAVVAAAERVADLLEGMLGQRAGEVHGGLPGDRYVVGPALAGHVAVTDLEVVGH